MRSQTRFPEGSLVRCSACGRKGSPLSIAGHLHNKACQAAGAKMELDTPDEPEQPTPEAIAEQLLAADAAAAAGGDVDELDPGGEDDDDAADDDEEEGDPGPVPGDDPPLLAHHAPPAVAANGSATARAVPVPAALDDPYKPQYIALKLWDYYRIARDDPAFAERFGRFEGTIMEFLVELADTVFEEGMGLRLGLVQMRPQHHLEESNGRSAAHARTA